MYGMSFVTAFVTLYMMLMTAWLNSMAANSAVIASVNTAGHLAIYSCFVSAYAQANPGFTGTVSDAAAAFPTWFTRIAGESNYVTGGAVYVYATPMSRANGMAIARNVGGTKTGIDDAGLLTVPGLGATTQAVPGAVPVGSVVIVR